MFITINNLNIHYQRFEGNPQAPTTLLLHGWGACGETMRGIFDNLKAQNKSVILVDIPPFGKSEKPSNDHNIHKFARLIKDFIIKLSLERINLIGHSFGGRISLILCAEQHDEFIVDKLVLTGGAGLKPKRTLNYHFRVCAYKLKKRLGLNTISSGSADYKALPDDFKSVFVRIVNTHLDSLLPQIQIPTLLIWGQNDLDTPLYMAKKLERGIKNSKLIILPNAGHYAFLDAPNIFYDLINAFL